MFDLFGSGMPLAARFFIAFLVVLALIGVTAWLVRRFGSARLGGANARGRQPRLAVIDAASVDGRRRLVLIRRDNIEHLLMIGGPTDVVIEPNIVRAAPAREPARAEPSMRRGGPRGRLAAGARGAADGADRTRCRGCADGTAPPPSRRPNRRTLAAGRAGRTSASGRQPLRIRRGILQQARAARTAAGGTAGCAAGAAARSAT